MANAGRYEPGATYIYEKADGVTYARKMGDPADARFEIGREYYPDSDPKVLGMPIRKIASWVDILEAAEHTPALQDALDRAKVIYELSRQHESVDHYPV